ncbi:hypothetical protein P6144_05995 [Sphingomonas sp. HITSZ_GF]|uniref:hypothetical protein n=1 Tax=Sphingomonas sp. HITSZ_GF TaxID=3037247 RepID=UPI00240E01EC|nr:hypothetical protein [Sphingomonas sp. HITSZ_GF]MDG2533189.1 hypothetical protein [Sphingomonas sp. HITSZ_GF]
MARGGPRRLTPYKMLAGIYPHLFAMAYWANLRFGRATAIDKGLTAVLFVSWVPLLCLLIALLMPWQGPVAALPVMIVLPASAFALWRLHKTLLIKRRMGLRYLDRHSRMDPADQLWMQVLTLSALALLAIGTVLMLRWGEGRRPPVQVVSAEHIAR